jgi:hypothetical protein
MRGIPVVSKAIFSMACTWGQVPGNIGQVSFYDAVARGECYRDFGDPVGVYSGVLVQGLYGILPDCDERINWSHPSRISLRTGSLRPYKPPILISTSKEKIKPIPIRSNHHLKRGLALSHSGKSTLIAESNKYTGKQ